MASSNPRSVLLASNLPSPRLTRLGGIRIEDPRGPRQPCQVVVLTEDAALLAVNIDEPLGPGPLPVDPDLERRMDQSLGGVPHGLDFRDPRVVLRARDTSQRPPTGAPLGDLKIRLPRQQLARHGA